MQEKNRMERKLQGGKEFSLLDGKGRLATKKWPLVDRIPEVASYWESKRSREKESRPNRTDRKSTRSRIQVQMRSERTTNSPKGTGEKGTTAVEGQKWRQTSRGTRVKGSCRKII